MIILIRDLRLQRKPRDWSRSALTDEHVNDRDRCGHDWPGAEQTDQAENDEIGRIVAGAFVAVEFGAEFPEQAWF